jgi:membrane protease YdiL (CAAX protease family)
LPEPDLNQFARRRRPRSAGIVTLAIAWFFAARLVADHSASGLTLRFGQSSLQPLVMAAFLLFLLLVGLLLVSAVSTNDVKLRDLIGLPRRISAGQEWGLGAAIGWGATLVLLIPLVLARSLHGQLWLAPRAFWFALVGLLALALFSLAEEIVFRGYAFRRLIASTGPVRASVLMSLLYGLTYVLLFDSTWMSFVISVLFGLLLSIGWLRTHGLWLSWGIHFAWKASLSVLFGLPAAGATILSSIVDSQAFGRSGLTGGSLGPEASLLAAVALAVAMVAIFPFTRDYAWNYTHPAIMPGGYPVEVQPPSAHPAMEHKPAPPPPLIQILPSTPQSRSATDPPV